MIQEGGGRVEEGGWYQEVASTEALSVNVTVFGGGGLGKDARGRGDKKKLRRVRAAKYNRMRFVAKVSCPKGFEGKVTQRD